MIYTNVNTLPDRLWVQLMVSRKTLKIEHKSCWYFAIIVALVNHVFIYGLDFHWIADVMFLVLCLTE